MVDAQLPHPFGHELAELQRLLHRQPGRKRHQTAAVDARGHIARAAQTARHAMGHASNRRIAGRAPECRVVQIQGVDIDGEHRDAAVFPLRDGPVALQQLLQVRQRVTVPSSGRREPQRPWADARRSTNRASASDRCAAAHPRRGGVPRSESPGRRHRAAARSSFRSRTACRPCGSCAAARGRTRRAASPRAIDGGRPARGPRPAAVAGCGRPGRRRQ